jgi:hypothetical protein
MILLDTNLIAAARGLIVASRDIAPFHAAGVRTINPWAAAPVLGAHDT